MWGDSPHSEAAYHVAGIAEIWLTTTPTTGGRSPSRLRSCSHSSNERSRLPFSSCRCGVSRQLRVSGHSVERTGEGSKPGFPQFLL